jgi:hypothetical protein
MATLEQEATERDSLRKTLEELAAIEAEELVRSDVLGSALNFRDGVPYFKRVLKLFKDLTKTNLDDASYNALTQLSAQARSALQLFKEIQGFDPSKHNNPVQVKDGLITRARDIYDSYYQVVTPITAYLIRMGTDFEALERKAKEHFDNTVAESSREQDKQKNITSDMQAILESVKKAAAEVGVSQHAIHFREEALKHSKESLSWLIAAIILAVVAGMYSLWSFRQSLALAPAAAVAWWPHVTYLVSRLLVLSVIFFGMGWSARNYRAHKHNEVVNTHRQNALRTFETFAKAAADKDTKDAVLLEATKCIFEGQSSGYLSAETEQVPSSTVIEVLRKVTASRGPS